MTDIKSVAGESDITPMNDYVRLGDVQVDGETMSGTVTDGDVTLFGDIVYFPKNKAMLMRINGQEVCFVKEDDIVFKVILFLRWRYEN
jgi:hypothetical protein